MSQDFIDRAISFSKGKTAAVSFLILAILMLLTTPFLVYDFYTSTGDIGAGRWPILAISAGMRFVWIYFFFGRWVAYKRASQISPESVDLGGQ